MIIAVCIVDRDTPRKRMSAQLQSSVPDPVPGHILSGGYGMSLEPAPVLAPSCYLVGRDPSGLWVAAETHGRGGGIFRTQEAAFHFAAFETGRRPGAIILTSQPVTLRL